MLFYRQMTRIVTLGISLLMLAGCGQNAAPSSGLNDDEAELPWTITPEYAKSEAIVFSLGNVLLRDLWFPGGYVDKLISERVEMYHSIMTAMPEVKYAIYSDPFMESDGTFSKDRLQTWLYDRIPENVEYQSVWGPNDIERGWPDEWARDYVPLTIKNNGGERRLLLYSSRGEEANTALAESYDIETVDVTEDNGAHLEAGDIMVDSQGNCFFANEDRRSSAVENYCNTSTFTGYLSYEGTTHIDLFAKFVYEKQVVVSNYLSNEVGILQPINEMHYVCSADQAANENWHECRFEKFVSDQERISLKRLQDGQPIRLTPLQVVPKLKELAGSQTVISFNGERADDLILEPNWVEFSTEVQSLFEGKGYRVHPVDAPTPLLKLTKYVYKSESNLDLRRELDFEFVFRSYVNSLVTNGKAFIPVFPETGGRDRDMGALGIYQELGLDSTPIPSDYATLGGGAVHCLTHQIGL